MATEIKLPVLGENVESATVVKLLIKPGDMISLDQPIMELETEKASVDLPAPAAGKAKDIQVKEGDTVKVGQILLTIEENGQPSSTPTPNVTGATAAQPTDTPPPQPPQIKVKKVEEPAVAPPASVAPQVETPLPAPAVPPEPATPAGSSSEKGFESPAVSAPAAPSLRRMARELGIDIHAVTGTGPEGRITEDDIRNYARSIILNATVPESGSAAALPDFSRWGEIERKAMTTIRRKTAEHVQEAWSSSPQFTQA